jgi:cell division protease FtsH
VSKYHKSAGAPGRDDDYLDGADDEGKTLSPVNVLPDLVLGAGMADSVWEMLDQPGGKVLIISVPTAAWAEPIARAMRAKSPGARVYALTSARTGMLVDDTRTSAHLAKDGLVVGISQDPATYIPLAFRAAADAVITLAPPDVAILKKLIRVVTGESTRTLVAADLSGLDFYDLVNAVRPDTTAKDCVMRLRRAAASKSITTNNMTPPLTAMPVYGAVRAWAYETLEEIALMRAGKVKPNALESCILFGPPGNGKSTIVRAFARSAGLPLIETSVASWFSNSTGHIDTVLQQAQEFGQRLLQSAPAIGFTDEIDAIPNRATMEARNGSYWTPVVTGILLMIDTLRRSEKGIILIGATNHLERLDQALIRPGRYDRHVYVGPPQTEEDFTAVLRHYVGNDLPGVNLDQLCKFGLGASPAVIESWLRGARRAARSADRPLRVGDLLDQMAPVETRSKDQLLACALHEAGHACVAVRLGMHLGSVSIKADGDAGGLTAILGSPWTPRLEDIETSVTIGLAGRAADEIIGRGPDVGAVADLAACTRLLVAAESSYGLGASLLYRGADTSPEALLAQDIHLREAVHDALDRLMRRARKLVTENRKDILRLADALIAARVLSGAEAETILEGRDPLPQNPQSGLRCEASSKPDH